MKKIRKKIKEVLMRKKEPDERPLWKKIIYPIAGFLLILLGIIGWLLPVVPGFPFLIMGVPLLFFYNRTYERKARSLIKKLLAPFMAIIKKRRGK
jgi:uncharacterized membrane protein YbaN (DUF454 family)